MSVVSVFRTIFIIAAVMSPFIFPYPMTVVLSFIASLFVPLLGLAIGLLSDSLYFVPQASEVPMATLIGAGVSLAGLLVRRFVKARIISG